MPKRLLFINSSLSDGGSEKAMVLVAQAMADLGYDVDMALVRDKPHVYKVDERIRITQFHNDAKHRVRTLISRLMQIRGLVKSLNPDYVIAYMWDINITTLIATVGLGVPVAVSERGYPASDTRSWASRFMEWVTYPRASSIVYQTEQARSYCPKRLSKRSTVIPNVIERVSPNKTDLTRKQRMVSVGRLKQQKNFPLLFTAYAEFLKYFPEWSLEIYGDGPLRDQLERLVSSLGIQSSVEFRGYVTDVASQIADAGLFVLASDFEGISNAMTEAMSLGLPVVCTDCPVGGAALVIENGVNGLLVPVNDKQELLNAMLRVASEPSLAHDLGMNAISIQDKFSAQAIGDMWDALLDGRNVRD